MRGLIEILVVTAIWAALILNSVPHAGPIAVFASIVAITFFQVLRQERWSHLGLRFPRSWIGLGAGTLATIGVFLSVVVLSPLILQFADRLTGGAERALPDVTTMSHLLMLLLLSWTTAAIGEEMIFRGFLMTRVADLFGRSAMSWVVALVLSSIIFGSLHAYQGINGMLVTGMVGFIFGVWYLIGRRNLLPLIIAHGLVDTMSVMALYLVETGVIAPEAVGL
ncbi:MAG: CPBP family intramembrane glutamic endopeptidase [Pseudomonadota bacterium]